MSSSSTCPSLSWTASLMMLNSRTARARASLSGILLFLLPTVFTTHSAFLGYLLFQELVSISKPQYRGFFPQSPKCFLAWKDNSWRVFPVQAPLLFLVDNRVLVSAGDTAQWDWLCPLKAVWDRSSAPQKVATALFVEVNLSAKWWIKTMLMLGEGKCELRDLQGLDIFIHHGQQARKGNGLV